ncbi:MAG: hypothetical protein RSD40_02020 [Bacilli bacterium]
MGRKVLGISLTDDLGYLELTCTFNFNLNTSETEEFETPYNYDVLINREVSNDNIKSIEIQDAEELFKVIDNIDCLPDIGPLDYTDKNLKLKNISLRDLLKEVSNTLLG